MITATLRDLEIKLQGHAGSAPAGEDLVCAGVTTLCYGLVQVLVLAAEEGLLTEPPTIELEPGHAHITAVPLPQSTAYLKGAFQTTTEGMRLLAKQYPEWVCLEGEDTAKR